MILTCPQCATRYFVDDAKLGEQGRKVRCAGCSHAWRARAEAAPLDLASVARLPEESAQPVRPAQALPQSFRAREQARRRTRAAAATGAVWAGLAAGLAATVLAAVVFRGEVVGLWPRTAGAYAALHLTVNPLGLSPEGVQVQPGLKDGRAMLYVRGVERNVEAGPRPAAPLQVSLYDKGGQRLFQQVAEVRGPPLRPGEGRAFQAAFVDPPLSGVQVGVDFVFPVRPPRESPARRRPPVAVATAALRSEAARPLPARLAQPLPAGSPDALPVAARAQAGGAQPDG